MLAKIYEKGENCRKSLGTIVLRKSTIVYSYKKAKHQNVKFSQKYVQDKSKCAQEVEK
jgi:hypothetical protein